MTYNQYKRSAVAEMATALSKRGRHERKARHLKPFTPPRRWDAVDWTVNMDFPRHDPVTLMTPTVRTE